MWKRFGAWTGWVGRHVKRSAWRLATSPVWGQASMDGHRKHSFASRVLASSASCLLVLHVVKVSDMQSLPCPLVLPLQAPDTVTNSLHLLAGMYSQPYALAPFKPLPCSSCPASFPLPPPSSLLQAPDIVTNSLDLLAEITSRYGAALPDQSALQAALLPELDRDRAGVRKRTIQCLGGWLGPSFEGGGE